MSGVVDETAFQQAESAVQVTPGRGEWVLGRGGSLGCRDFGGVEQQDPGDTGLGEPQGELERLGSHRPGSSKRSA